MESVTQRFLAENLQLTKNQKQTRMMVIFDYLSEPNDSNHLNLSGFTGAWTAYVTCTVITKGKHRFPSVHRS